MLTFVPYREIEPTWPREGRAILSSWDESTVVVYQAYRASIGRFAAEHGYFGGDFSLNRMSWVKPNFLWMMYRSGWGTKPDQEVILAVRLKRAAFDEILAAAVPSSWDRDRYVDRAAWQDAVAASDVRLQWDPDHAPSGAPLERRAIQLGLRGSFLARYAREWIVGIEDISPIVARERANIGTADLLVPAERVYPSSAVG
ncbi:MAG: DUF4291 domain-containing protein [Labilithrix sp.]